MARKKKTPKEKGLSNTQINFMIAKAMRSGAFKRIVELAKSGASKEEVKLAVMQQYSPHARPGLEGSSDKLSFLEGHLDKLADQLIERYGPKGAAEQQ